MADTNVTTTAKAPPSHAGSTPSPVGYALAGALVGGLGSAFLGYGLGIGALVGAGGGYAWGLSRDKRIAAAAVSPPPASKG